MRKGLIDRVTSGDGKASKEHRRAAFDGGGPEGAKALIEKVAKHAYKVTDEDVAAAKAATSEDEVFETVVSAAVGQAKRQYDAAMAALEKA